MGPLIMITILIVKGALESKSIARLLIEIIITEQRTSIMSAEIVFPINLGVLLNLYP